MADSTVSVIHGAEKIAEENISLKNKKLSELKVNKEAHVNIQPLAW